MDGHGVDKAACEHFRGLGLWLGTDTLHPRVSEGPRGNLARQSEVTVRPPGVEDVRSWTFFGVGAGRHYARVPPGSGGSRPRLRVLRFRSPFQVRLLREA